MIFQPNALFFKMAELVKDRPKEDKLIIINEGGSRSSKTWDAIALLVWLCDHNRHLKLDIYLFRDTLVNCKEYLLKDFEACLSVMGIYRESNMRDKNGKPNYTLFGQTLKFRGLDDQKVEIKESTGSDILFFNEVLSGCDKERVESYIMRCRMLVLADFNPKYTDHWLFNYEKRSNCTFIRSTYKNNRHLEPSIIKGIEEYEPTPENIANGTADLFRWKVYGLGERANREGLVFPNVTWIDSFPDDIEEIGFGMDFGIAHNTALVKVGVRRKPEKSDLYIEKLFYAPTENSTIIGQMINSLKEKHKIEFIWCDNNQPGWVSDLRNNFNISALLTKKFPGSRKYWIDTMNRFNIHIVKDVDMRKEQENFCYRVVDGITLSETIDKYDDGLSAAGYGTVGNFRFDNI